MRTIPLFVVVVVVVLFKVASAKPSLFHAFPTYYEQLAAPRTNVLHSIKSQFHTQDELGQYTYGYNDGLSSKIESKTTDGVTQGSYAYVDPNGIIQNVNYIADDLNGFRVFASNLPVAPTYQFPIHEDIMLAQENPTQVPIISVTGMEAIMDDVAPLSPVYQQFHAQDELGQYSYGYSGGPSSKMEMKTADGITRGGYSYVDANGILQKVNYIADPINGFRVAATNLPMSNMATAYYPTEYHFPEFNFMAHPEKGKSLD